MSDKYEFSRVRFQKRADEYPKCLKPILAAAECWALYSGQLHDDYAKKKHCAVELLAQDLCIEREVIFSALGVYICSINEAKWKKKKCSLISKKKDFIHGYLNKCTTIFTLTVMATITTLTEITKMLTVTILRFANISINFFRPNHTTKIICHKNEIYV
jgi:hypothetical protein